jgi:tetratricopeptide (TPR) repeat protein
MPNLTELSPRLQQLIEARSSLEQQLQAVRGEPRPEQQREYEGAYTKLQRSLAQLARETSEPRQRVGIMLELLRILESKLVYLQNFSVDPSGDNRTLATLVLKFLDEMRLSGSEVLTPLEATYYRGIAALYSGDHLSARDSFQATCESEESDEANDVKYKSYVILGHLSHEDRDYAKAKQLHERSMQYTQQTNVTAQALAFKALNAYALQDLDEALELFERSLQLFNPDEPFFNSYFYRNALLFCGSIYFDRRDYATSRRYYERVAGEVEQNSYDYFDALAHLGRISYATSRFDDAVESFNAAIATHRFSDNEYLVDTLFWLAKAHLKRNDFASAKECLERVAAAEGYENRSQAVELLARVG